MNLTIASDLLSEKASKSGYVELHNTVLREVRTLAFASPEKTPTIRGSESALEKLATSWVCAGASIRLGEPMPTEEELIARLNAITQGKVLNVDSQKIGLIADESLQDTLVIQAD